MIARNFVLFKFIQGCRLSFCVKILLKTVSILNKFVKNLGNENRFIIKNADDAK